MSRILKCEEHRNNAEPYQFYIEFQGNLPGKNGNDSEEISKGGKREEVYEASIKEVEEILETAREQAVQIKEEAREEGLKEGHAEGFEAGRLEAIEVHEASMALELEKFKAEMTSSIQTMESVKEKVLEKYIDDLKDISLAVAEKIIQTSLKSSGEVIKRMIFSATDKLKKKQWAKIYVAKCDADLMVHGDAELVQELTRLSDNIKIVIMDKESSGTCIMELPDEIIDVSVNTQLENIKDILNNARL